MPFDLSDVVFDSEMGEDFQIIRTTGSFGAGGWIPDTPCDIPAFGIIAVAGDEDLRQVPEGDRAEGSLVIFSQTRLFETLASKSATSDKVMWHGSLYRVQGRGPWSEWGFQNALLLRETGE